MKKLILPIIAAAFFGFEAHAMDITVGGQIGSMSLTEGPAATNLGYGAFVQGSAFDFLGLQLDYMRTHFTNYGPGKSSFDTWGFSPNLLFNVVKFEEFRLGLLGGPGFFKVGSDSTRFAMSGGAFGEVSFIKYMPIGLQTRYHALFGGKDNNLWSVMMTVAFRFPIVGDNDW